MKSVGREVLLRFACVLALLALALIVWSLFDPRPIPVILAMSVAQGIGTLSFLAFLVVVGRDLRAGQRKQDESAGTPP